jgi:hypothetical protein
MSTEQEEASAEAARNPQKPAIEPSSVESLTDLLDRLDREAFRRSLELRDARLSAHGAVAHRR